MKLKKLTPTEDQEQITVFNWIAYSKAKYPELAFCFHVPNGGSRNVIEAAKLKRMGVLAGVPDIHLPVPSKGFNALYIELKTATGRVTKEQAKFGEFITNQGGLWVVCRGAQAAIKQIKDYLE